MELRERLRSIREPREIKNKTASVCASIGMLLLGAALGAIAKQLDGGVSGEGIFLRIAEQLNLGGVFSDLPVWLFAAIIIAAVSYTPVKAAVNVFLFFAGMNVVYHVWTIRFFGFDPGGYMLIWYGLTLISPLLAVVCWYARGKGTAATVAECLILAVLATFCFSFGWIYFGFKGVISTLIFIASPIILCGTPKQAAISGIGSIALAFVICPLNPIK